MVVMIATAVIVSASTYHVPGMSTAICGIERWPSEEEIVAMWVTGIDTEVPETVTPIEWAIEVGCSQEGIPLPVKQDITQILVATLPIGAKHVIVTCHPHQIVKVDLVCSLILCICQIQFISHLVGEEEGFIASLFVAHRLARSCCQQHHCQGYHYLFHIH